MNNISPQRNAPPIIDDADSRLVECPLDRLTIIIIIIIDQTAIGRGIRIHI